MASWINLVGKRFGRLSVIQRTKAKSKSSSYWLCLCDCGRNSIVAGCKLKSGNIVSCGCYRRENAHLFHRIHGMANKSLTYRSWKEMRRRCSNPNAHNWRWYGGAGVSVCERWNSYQNFFDDMGERPPGTSIDRINNGNYEPGNCRWATRKQQAESNRGCYKPMSAKQL